MKKVMLVAAVAALGCGAFAADCGPGPQKQTYGSALAYKWKFTGKTTEGYKAKGEASTSNWCGPTSPDAGCNFYRIKTSLKIEGYTFLCGNECGTIAFENFTEAHEVFWQTKPHKASIYGGVSSEIVHIIGKKKKQVEVLGTTNFLLCEANDPTHATYVLTYAGFGKYSTKYSRVTSVSGNFAGYATSCWAWNMKKDWCAKAGYWDCATLQLVGCGDPTIAYGKWSAKYSKSAAKKYLNNSKYRGKVPSWVTTDDNDNDHSLVKE